MEIEKIDEILEAVLFVAGSGIPADELTEKLELQKSELAAALGRLKEKYSGKCGIRLISYNGKVQFCSNPQYADTVSAVLNPIKEKALSKASLEVMAIIAYKQPVTRLEIETIRGINSDYAVQMLLKHNLIRVEGRKDVVGKPLLFGTTEEFLKRFGLESLVNLPDYDELMERLAVIRAPEAEKTDDSLYDNFEIPDEEPAPEFLEGETFETVGAVTVK